MVGESKEETEEKAEGLNVSSLTKLNDKELRDRFRSINKFLSDILDSNRIYNSNFSIIEVREMLTQIEDIFWAHRGQLENIYDYASAKLEEEK